MKIFSLLLVGFLLVGCSSKPKASKPTGPSAMEQKAAADAAHKELDKQAREYK